MKQIQFDAVVRLQKAQGFQCGRVTSVAMLPWVGKKVTVTIKQADKQ